MSAAGSPGAVAFSTVALRNPLFGRAVVHEAAPGLSRGKPTRPTTTVTAIGSERPWRLLANVGVRN